MLDALRRPLQPQRLVLVAGGSTLLVALYCIAYSTFAGRPETFATALGWTAANVLPWLVAIEMSKRAATTHEAAALLLGATAASLALGYATGASAGAPWFELVRRLPSLVASAAVVALLRSGVGSNRFAREIPLLPSQIDWVRAAGNYVELRSADRTIVHRASLTAIEAQLARHNFVRIHRSLLVRRDRIARVRPQDLVLVDGTHLKVGKRYRAALAA